MAASRARERKAAGLQEGTLGCRRDGAKNRVSYTR
jgi:hypothetical protein